MLIASIFIVYYLSPIVPHRPNHPHPKRSVLIFSASGSVSVKVKPMASSIIDWPCVHRIILLSQDSQVVGKKVRGCCHSIFPIQRIQQYVPANRHTLPRGYKQRIIFAMYLEIYLFPHNLLNYTFAVNAKTMNGGWWMDDVVCVCVCVYGCWRMCWTRSLNKLCISMGSNFITKSLFLGVNKRWTRFVNWSGSYTQ